MRTASKILVAIPTLAVGYDLALWHFPFYMGCLVLVLCLLVLAIRAYHWCREHRAEVREAALFGAPFAAILLLILLLK